MNTKSLPVGSMRIIANLDDPEFILVTQDQDAQSVREHIGDEATEYDSFFVKIQEGDYTEVWGFCGIVPCLDNLATKLI